MEKSARPMRKRAFAEDQLNGDPFDEWTTRLALNGPMDVLWVSNSGPIRRNLDQVIVETGEEALLIYFVALPLEPSHLPGSTLPRRNYSSLHPQTRILHKPNAGAKSDLHEVFPSLFSIENISLLHVVSARGHPLSIRTCAPSVSCILPAHRDPTGSYHG